MARHHAKMGTTSDVLSRTGLAYSPVLFLNAVNKITVLYITARTATFIIFASKVNIQSEDLMLGVLVVG